MRYFVVILGVFLLSHSVQGQECEQAFTPEEPFDRSKTENIVRDINHQFNYKYRDSINFAKGFKDFVTEKLPTESARLKLMSEIGHSMLEKSIEHQSPDMVKTLLELGVETELSDLIRSVRVGGTEEILKTILQQTSKEYTLKDLQPVLSKAIFNQNIQSIKLLFNKGVRPNARDIFYLFHNKHEYLLRDLNEHLLRDLKSKNFDINVKGVDGWTALHQAIAYTEFSNINSVMRSLLRYGADPNARGDYGDTPIHIFARAWDSYKNSERVMSRQDLEQRIKILVEFGADMSATDIHNRTALNRLIERHLKEDGDGGYMNAIEVLLSVANDMGIKLNASLLPSDNKTFREYDFRSVYSSSSAVSIFLLNLLQANRYDLFAQVASHIKDINVRDEDNFTLMHFLFKLKNPPTESVVKILVEQGADINAVNDYGLTPLDYAKRSNLSVGEVNYLSSELGFKTGKELKKEATKAKIDDLKTKVLRFFGLAKAN